MIWEKIFSFEYKTITVEQLMKMAGNIEYGEFVDIINRCAAEKIIEPIKSSGKNGRSPAVYNKYRILKPENDYTNAIDEIKMLHPRFNHSKYAKYPEMYIKYKKEIDLLSKFLWENEELLKKPISINERSFQIWGKEKLIKDSSIIRSIFQYNDWDLSLLNYFETPEPFFEYIFSNEKQMNILVIENKDTWFGLRKIMRENKLNNLFRNYQVLLYGEGKKIISKNNRLAEYNNLLEDSINKYYYFGDLDYEGIDIYQSLIEKNKNLDINLCTELYLWMLKESEKYDLPETKEGQRKIDIEEFLNNFNYEDAEKIKNILRRGLYIPQEILNYQLFKTKMKEGLKI